MNDSSEHIAAAGIRFAGMGGEELLVARARAAAGFALVFRLVEKGTLQPAELRAMGNHLKATFDQAAARLPLDDGAGWLEAAKQCPAIVNDILDIMTCVDEPT